MKTTGNDEMDRAVARLEALADTVARAGALGYEPETVTMIPRDLVLLRSALEHWANTSEQKDRAIVGLQGVARQKGRELHEARLQLAKLMPLVAKHGGLV